MVAKKDAENKVPAVKKTAAKARALPVDPFTVAVESQVSPVVAEVLTKVNEVVNSEAYQVTASKVTPGIPASVRNVLYNIGFYLGIVATVAPSIIAALTGNAAVVGATVLGIVLVVNNALSKANLSKTAADIAKETPA